MARWKASNKLEAVPEGLYEKPKADLSGNPIVNLRDADGKINPEMERKLADMQRAPGGYRLVTKWIEDARAAGFSLHGTKLTA